MLENTPTGTRENGPYDMWDKCLKESENIKLEYKEVDSVRKHLAPNGEISKLPELYAKVVRTPTFLNWFGDWTKTDKTGVSKVVYEDTQEPMIVFHGTEKYIPSTEGLQPKKKLEKDKNNQKEKLFLTNSILKADYISKKNSTNNSQIFSGFLKIVEPEHRASSFHLEENPLKSSNCDGVVINHRNKLLSSLDFVVFSSNDLFQIPSALK